VQKTTIYITKHGETQWIAEGRMQGRHDSPLTELGIRQATWLRDALEPIDFDVIYASSSLRVLRTAEIIRHQRGCELICRDELREIYTGDWEGQLWKEIEQKYPAAYSAFWKAPHLYRPEGGGESYIEVQARVLSLLDSVLTKHKGETILLVTHAGPLKLLMGHVEGRPLARLWEPPFVHPTALCKVIAENQRFSIELYGDTSHYQEKV
jgi:broad specificity phosphatase PhoE